MLGRRLNLEEIGRLAGVSRSTVSRVVNGSPNVSDEAKARVEAVVRQTGYRPHAAARSLAANRSTWDTGQATPLDEGATRSEIVAGRHTADLLDDPCGEHEQLQDQASFTETVGCESCGATLGVVS